jgi:hypothetical protein
MRMPGFVAEASLSNVTEFRAGDGYSRAVSRRSSKGRATIEPQQVPPWAEITTPLVFVDRCHQRCSDVQDRVRAQCAGRCFTFLGPQSISSLSDCSRACVRGEDYPSEPFGGHILAGPPELKPGYCALRCPTIVTRRVSPPVFVTGAAR